jgi:hypothetical protein
MGLKYVIDEETKQIKTTEDGLPFVIDDSKEGAEPYGLDGIGLMAKIPSLQKEAKEKRIELKQAKEKLESFEELDIDVENFNSWRDDAKKALETVKNLDSSKLIEADKVEELKNQVRQELTDERARIEKQYKQQLKEKEESLSSATSQINELVVGNKFLSSSFINENLILTPKMARKVFGDKFKVETHDNQAIAVGYDENNEPIMSRSNIGKYADFDEALKHLIDSDPDRDTYIKAETKKTKSEPQTPYSFQSANPSQMSSTDKIRAGLVKRGLSD